MIPATMLGDDGTYYKCGLRLKGRVCLMSAQAAGMATEAVSKARTTSDPASCLGLRIPTVVG